MRMLAGMVHIFTAAGIVCALFATEAVIAGRFEQCFIWLAIALVIDAVDGTFARALDVKTRVPRFSGERLDLVIDYVTYVFVPVLALLGARHLAGATGTFLASGILLSSLYHFADQDSKTADNCFVGFPAIWNIFAFFIFALAPSPGATAGATALAIGATFVPSPWVHPLRVVALRPVTLTMTALTGLAGIMTLRSGFPATPLLQMVLLASAAYYVVLSALWWLRPPQPGAPDDRSGRRV